MRASDSGGEKSTPLKPLEEWLSWVESEADRRGLPDLKPIARVLARNATALRTLDRAADEERGV